MGTSGLVLRLNICTGDEALVIYAGLWLELRTFVSRCFTSRWYRSQMKWLFPHCVVVFFLFSPVTFLNLQYHLSRFYRFRKEEAKNSLCIFCRQQYKLHWLSTGSCSQVTARRLNICSNPKLVSGSTRKVWLVSQLPAFSQPDMKTSAWRSSVAKAIHTSRFSRKLHKK